MLDEKQKEAVNHTEGPCMVLAGPGSGKTTVIVARIKALIDAGVLDDSILVITFTRAAANEMKSRYIKTFGSHSIGLVTFGTFHSIFFHILSKYYRFGSDSILNTATRNQIFRAFSHKNKINDFETLEDYDALALEISNVKSGKYSMDEYMPTIFRKELFCKAYEFYCDSLQRNKMIDFDDMVLIVYRMFTEHPDRLKFWQEKYRYILIDEFQDIARNQYETVKLLCSPRNNIFVVGDDDQSIYGFRGASPEIMLGFPKDYSGCKTVILGANYRCTPEILTGANNLISHNKIRYKKDLYAVREHSHKRIHILKFENTYDEYRFIISEIERYHSDGIAYSDMAILYRVNSQIPSHDGNEISEVVGDILSYLKILDNAASRSDFIRILNRPQRGLLREAFEYGDGFDGLKSFYDYDHGKLQEISRWEYCMKMAGNLGPFAAINFLRHSIGYQKYIDEYKDNKKRECMQKNMDEILEAAKTKKNIRDVISFLENKLAKNLSSAEKDMNDGVRYLTMHGAKGLEFSVVFIPQVNESLVPIMKERTQNTLEEERRLFYVAMTRAKNELYISYVNKKADRLMSASRFIDEISAPQSECRANALGQSYKQDA